MVLYSGCGFLGMGQKLATKSEYLSSGSDPAAFYSSCGMGVLRTRATASDVPDAWAKACPGSQVRSEAEDKCVAVGAVCTPGNRQALSAYSYDSAGECSFRGCTIGSIERPAFSMTRLGAVACPAGYKPITDQDACRSASAHYRIPNASPFVMDEGHQPNGCTVYGGDHAKVAFNTNAGAANARSFSLCARDDSVDTCVRAGQSCDGALSNYTYNAKGFCQGSCASANDRCAASDRCCSGTCVPEGVPCPRDAALQDSASQIADSIHSLDSVMQSFKSMHGIKGAMGKL